LGIDKYVVDTLPETTRVEFISPTRTYTTDLLTFKEKGVKRNYGFGDQYLLPIEYFDPPQQKKLEFKYIPTTLEDGRRVMVETIV